MRLAHPEDRGQLADFANSVLSLSPSGASELGARFAEQLALAPGEDHFVLLVEADDAPGGLAGYLIAGACRDSDAKGDGEIYELVVAPGRSAARAGSALLNRALLILGGARYGAIRIWLGEVERTDAVAARRAGFAEDGARRAGALRFRVDPAGSEPGSDE